MTYWSVRESLSQANRLRRSYYELLRDELDQFMLEHALTNSYLQFLERKEPYPFVEKRELKPRARVPDIEYDCHNTFLVIFLEDTLSSAHKKHIRFFNANKITKTNLLQSKALPLAGRFDRNQKYIESIHFFNFLKVLLPADYALLIQRDPASLKKDRYLLSHYHVRIDWPIADGAEFLARDLRYISKDLYEKGDKYAEDIQKKFFEYYGLSMAVGGRRTAAIVAAQYLKRMNCISTIYAGSSESRFLLRISERGISKTVLMKFSPAEMREISESQSISVRSFIKNYVVFQEKQSGICIFQAFYLYTEQAIPPEDGKLREVKPDLNWLTVGGQYILPKSGAFKSPPLATNLIYS